MLLFPFFLTVVLSLLVIVILITRKKHDKINRWLISTILLTVVFQVLVFFITATGRLSSYWYLFRLGCPFYYLTPPLVYLYIAYNLKKDRKVFARYYLHFIPFGISLLDIGWYYLTTTSADRLSEIEMITNFPTEEFFLGAGFLPPLVHYYFRLVQRIFYIGLQWWTLLLEKPANEAHRSTYRWTTFITIVQTAILIGYGYYAAQISLHSTQGNEATVEFARKISLLIIFLGVVAICLYLFLYPELLYGRALSEQKASSTKKTKHSEPETDKGQSTEDGQHEWLPKGIHIDDLCRRVDDFMLTEKPFLQKRMSLNQIAHKLEIPPYLLSALLNKHYGKNFRDFVNEYRIRQILTHIKDNPNWDQLTIEGIAFEAGFSSRTAFYAAFKKLTGKTPGVYLLEWAEAGNYTDHLGPVLKCPSQQKAH